MNYKAVKSDIDQSLDKAEKLICDYYQTKNNISLFIKIHDQYEQTKQKKLFEDRLADAKIQKQKVDNNLIKKQLSKNLKNIDNKKEKLI